MKNNISTQSNKETEEMVRQKTLTATTIVLMVVIGWDNVVKFLNSFIAGTSAMLDATPPMILLALAIGIVWYGRTKN